MDEIKSIEIIPSKSDAHRAIICAALSKEPCRIVCSETSEDIEATKACMTALRENGNNPVGIDLYCKESGSTLRFLLPIVGALGMRGIFHPQGGLSKRPLSPLYEELISHGMRISPPGSVPLIAEGKLEAGEYIIPGDISSQFVTGLLFTLPLLDGDSRIVVRGELESAGYVDMTLNTLSRFGIKVDVSTEMYSTIYALRGNQEYISPKEYKVEGDWSNGAFWLAAGIIGDEPIEVKGLSSESCQGDKAIVDVIKTFGGDIKQKESSVLVYPSSSKLRGITYDASQTPDMIPVIALIATQAAGTTRILHAERLRLKESDRLHSIHRTIKALGGSIEELEDGLIIKGKTDLTGGVVDSFSDHRIAMMAGIASLITRDKVQIIGSESANKSYPGFFDELKNLGLGCNLEI